MQWSLSVLFVMGQCSLLVCQLYEYHFIDEEKTWDEAKDFCRRHYTDLATVNNMTDMKRLNLRGQEGWIGLRNQTDRERTWRWSMPGVEFIDSETQWDTEEVGEENCAGWNEDKWEDFPCGHMKNFICYNETTNFWINESMTWRQAQISCRKNGTELISGHGQVKQLNGKSRDGDWWIGLFKDSWTWSDGSPSSFRNWDQFFVDRGLKKTCAMTLDDGYWSADECDQKRSFFCYDDKFILINKPLTWEGALHYCRTCHTDLASITDLHQQRWAQERAKAATTGWVWLGLRYTCSMDLWFWVNDHLPCYRNWGRRNQTHSCAVAAAMNTSTGYWEEKRDTELLSFICLRFNMSGL